MDVRDDVIQQVLLGPMREEAFRSRDPAELDVALREQGFELTPDELKLVREVRQQAQGLEDERLDEFLRANATWPAKSMITRGDEIRREKGIAATG